MKKCNIILASLLLAILVCLIPAASHTALAITNGTDDGTYDFGGMNNLIGDYFIVGDKFKVQSSPDIIQVDGAVSSNTALAVLNSPFQIEAEGGSTCHSFTFVNLGLSKMSGNTDTIMLKNAYLSLYDSTNTLIQTINLGNATSALPADHVVNLSNLFGKGPWYIGQVSKLSFGCNIQDGLGEEMFSLINFENITLADVYNGTPIALTSPAVNGAITPVRGQLPAAYSMLTSADPLKYYVTNLTWKTPELAAASFSADGKFLPGTQYVAEMVLTAGPIYTFTDSPSTTLNFLPTTLASVTNPGTAGNQMTFRYTYPATASLSGIAINHQPTKLNYFDGDALDLSGLVATLQYTDSSSENIALADFATNGITTNPANGATLSRTTHNGTSVAVTKGTYTAHTSDLTVAVPSYDIGTDSSSGLNFGTAVVGYTSAPVKQTVTVTNNGNSAVTLQQPSATGYTLGTLSATSLEPGQSATLTVQPNLALGEGSHNATLTVNTNQSTHADVLLTFTVAAASYTISANPSSLTFANTIEAYFGAPPAQTVTITNTGNQPVTLQQPTDANFDITTLSATTLNPGRSATFSVRPKLALGVGSYATTLTVNTNQSTHADVALAFAVEAATFDISTSPSSLTFTNAVEGYMASPSAQTVTVTNNGNQRIQLQQPTSADYLISTPITSALNPGDSTTFTVQPKLSLAVGSHNATLTVITDADTSANVALAFTVLAPDYSISISPTSIPFDNAVEGYAEYATKTVTVTNNGNMSVTLLTPGMVDFTVSNFSASTLGPGESATFTIRPNTDLKAGGYGGLMTVYTGQATEASVSVSFSVTKADYTLGTGATTQIDFGNKVEGYTTAPTSTPVTITNIGNKAVTLQQPTATGYSVSTLEATTLAVGAATTVYVQPELSLGVGNHDATLTIATDQGSSTTVPLSFTVTKADYSMGISPTSLSFGSVIEGYATAPTAQTVTVTNNGNATVTLQQPTAADYTVGTLSATTLAPNATATFTVQPNLSLTGGLYDATLTVSSNQGSSVDLPIAFSVTSASHAFTFTPNTITFDKKVEGYAAAPAAQTVTVTNTGNVTYSLAQPTATNFDIGTLSATSFAPNESVTFTVRPKIGLTAGTYSEQISILRDRSIARSVSVSFTVDSRRTSLTVNPTSLNFDTQVEGYAAAPAAQTVTITNTGNVDVSIGTPTSTHFDIGTLSATLLAPNATATFTVRPKTGLAAGAYSETLLISPVRREGEAVEVTFAVVSAVNALSVAPDSVSFGSLAQGYPALPTQTITVANTGNTTLTLYQPTAANFSLGSLSARTLQPTGTATFTLTPKTGLGVGTWDETISIYASDGARTQLTAAFTCFAPQIYTILSGNGSVFQPSTTTGLTFTANGPLSQFLGLTLNGTPLPPSFYEVQSGSTIVTLHRDFLAKLPAGAYTLGFHYTNGYAEANFVVQEAMAVTGDNDELMIFGLISAISALGLALLWLRRRRFIRH